MQWHMAYPSGQHRRMLSFRREAVYMNALLDLCDNVDSLSVGVHLVFVHVPLCTRFQHSLPFLCQVCHCMLL